VLEAFAQCLRPCIFWNDNRVNANAAKIYGSVFFRQTTGNIVFPWLIVSKLFLIKHDKPNLFDGVSGAFLRKNHPHPRLRAEPVPEMSRAAGTSWFYVILRRWSDDLITAIGLGGTDMSHVISVCEQSDAVRLSFMQRKIG
jgi:sugar (pentulose or hexulose) kinase